MKSWNSTLARRVGLKARKALARKTPIRPVNPERKKRLHERNFGDKADWIRTLPCCVPSLHSHFEGGDCGGPVEAAHVTSRGAGGDSTSLVPMCRTHHRLQHTLGVRLFEHMRKIDLHALAAEYERRWQEE